MIAATIVDVDALWQTAWHAAVAGIVITVTFSLAVLGTTRSGDLRRVQRQGVGALYGALGVAGLVATFAAIVYGIVLVATK